MFGTRSDNGYREIVPGIRIKTISYGKSTLMVEFRLDKGSLLPEHAHVNEQIGYMVEGSMTLYVEGKGRTVYPGDSWCIPSNVRHKAEIAVDSVAVEVFSPCREDYLKFANAGDITE